MYIDLVFGVSHRHNANGLVVPSAVCHDRHCFPQLPPAPPNTLQAPSLPWVAAFCVLPRHSCSTNLYVFVTAVCVMREELPQGPGHPALPRPAWHGAVRSSTYEPRCLGGRDPCPTLQNYLPVCSGGGAGQATAPPRYLHTVHTVRHCKIDVQYR